MWRWQQLKLRARICSRKRVLISDPQLRKMTKSRWLFEGWQVRLEEEATAKKIEQVGTEVIKAIQQVIINTVGLNLEPIAEPDPDNPGESKYRWPKGEEFTPLILAIARPEYLSSALEKVNSLLAEPTDSGDTPAPLLDEEDLDFFDALEVDEKKATWESLETQQALKTYVIQMDPDKVDPLAPESAQPKPSGLTEADRQALWRDRTERVPAKVKFEVDEALDFDPEEFRER